MAWTSGSWPATAAPKAGNAPLDRAGGPPSRDAFLERWALDASITSAATLMPTPVSTVGPPGCRNGILLPLPEPGESPLGEPEILGQGRR
jgi:hypothetical protein